jgi:stage II sporulation protein AA (anti-sigma F factor antagonist)
MAEHVRKATSPTATAPGVGLTSPARQPLEVTVDRLAEGLVLVKVRGAIVRSTAPDLRRRLLGLAAPFDTFTRVLLDLSAVSFLDHSGLDALLQLQDRWSAADGSLELLSPSTSVVRLLHEADLDGESQMHTGQAGTER